jgi:hypothetical protein
MSAADCSREGVLLQEFNIINQLHVDRRQEPKASMLLRWSSRDRADRHSQDEELDEASVALLPKTPDDKFSDSLTTQQGSSDEIVSIEETEFKKPPWWSYIWVGRLSLRPSSKLNS